MNDNHSAAPDAEIRAIYARFFDEAPVSAEIIDSSRGEEDFRITAIVSPAEGEKRVLKIVSNDFTFPEKIRVWQRTAEEYRKLGYYCPRIYADREGNFPAVAYRGYACFAWGEEFSPYRSLEDRAAGEDSGADTGAGSAALAGAAAAAFFFSRLSPMAVMILIMHISRTSAKNTTDMPSRE